MPHRAPHREGHDVAYREIRPQTRYARRGRRTIPLFSTLARSSPIGGGLFPLIFAAAPSPEEGGRPFSMPMPRRTRQSCLPWQQRSSLTVLLRLRSMPRKPTASSMHFTAKTQHAGQTAPDPLQQRREQTAGIFPKTVPGGAALPLIWIE
jgi:hypothetical protein